MAYLYDLILKQPSLTCAACVADTILIRCWRCGCDAWASIDEYMLAYVVNIFSQTNLVAHINSGFYFSKEHNSAFITVYPTAISSVMLV